MSAHRSSLALSMLWSTARELRLVLLAGLLLSLVVGGWMVWPGAGSAGGFAVEVDSFGTVLRGGVLWWLAPLGVLGLAGVVGAADLARRARPALRVGATRSQVGRSLLAAELVLGLLVGAVALAVLAVVQRARVEPTSTPLALQAAMTLVSCLAVVVLFALVALVGQRWGGTGGVAVALALLALVPMVVAALGTGWSFLQGLLVPAVAVGVDAEADDSWASVAGRALQAVLLAGAAWVVLRELPAEG
ncbi:hypothetical protein SAMN05445756_1054 [Kytococcus aerolatus]|uniref:Uncharacterized protein n=1 Tax=Kytococcus aerolatus TaxID=592308 RepID=A0A212TE85_9MICO|nr:hypothetical protein [Kytococcus aerolatus]SNC64151.1 hypothetical protein SAMN05445756_1054 [Kytococcus aerolatus]